MNDPQVVIYVVVDEPNVPEQADSTYAQLLFRRIATEVFPYLGMYPTENVTPDLLAFLNMDESEIVKGGDVISDTFDCFDSYGRYYTSAFVNDKMQVVDSNGNVLEGLTVDEEAGTVTDALGNVKKVKLQREEEIDPVAENPDIATPLQENAEDGKSDTVWAGVTDEDLEEGA